MTIDFLDGLGIAAVMFTVCGVLLLLWIPKRGGNHEEHEERR